MPPPASGLSARLVLGPALRAQSDRRLVRLVREGYESAFEEIVRRYRRPLDRFAASIVGGRSEDVTQDSFRKALIALRDGEGEVELRPWLYRIVRNTALNDLRDRPPAAAELTEDLIGGGRSAAAVAEQREDVAMLTAGLLALPAKQRAALVMRELEGMGHEEIAAALGVSGGAARQAIARGRAAMRSGFGALLPLPLMRALAGGGSGASEAAGAGAAAGGAGAVAAGAGGVGAGALKLGLATLVVAGSIGAGVAIEHHGAAHHRSDPPEAAATAPGRAVADGVGSTPSRLLADARPTDHAPVEREAPPRHDRHRHHGADRGGRGGPRENADRHGGDGRGSGDAPRLAVPTESVPPVPDQSARRGGSGHDSPGGDDREQGEPGQDGGSGSRSSGSTRGGRGSGDGPAEVVGTEPAEPSSSGGPGPSSGGSDDGAESSGGSDSSDDGSETASSSPSTSGTSGDPSASLDSTGGSDDGSNSGGGQGATAESEISP